MTLHVEPGVITLELPYPLSVNRYWQPVHIPAKAGGKGGHMALVPTKEAKAYKSEVAAIARVAGVRGVLAGPVEVTYQLYPHLPQDWARRAKIDPVWWDLTVQCIDLDNSRKVVNDALKNIVFGDDSMIRKDPGEIMVPDGKARMVVTIKPFARAHPQEGLFAPAPVYVPKVKKAVAVARRARAVEVAPDRPPIPEKEAPF